MANIYVRSTDGSDADNGSTWALAKATLGAGAGGIDAAGDTIYVSQNHAETSATTQTYTGAGTAASPVRIICGNDAAEPPTAVAATATISMTGGGGNSINMRGNLFCYGIAFLCGQAAANNNLFLGGGGILEFQRYQNCAFRLVGSGASSQIALGNSGTTVLVSTVWDNCTVKFTNAGHSINVCSDFQWKGGSVESGTSTPTTNMFTLGNASRSGTLRISGVDFSNCSSSLVLVGGIPGGPGCYANFTNCKMPASWSGNLVASGTITLPGMRVELFNCDSADTNYRLWIEDYSGSIKHETTIVRTGGASDGVTGLAWKMATSANALFPNNRLESPEIAYWNDTTASSKTLTVEIVHDTNVAAGQGAGTGSRFQDDEIWLEVQYLGNGSFPLTTYINDCKADVLTTAADQADSSVTWTTTGLTTPQKQKLSVTFTPQEKGWYQCKVVMARASKTIYVCPKLDVT